VSSKEIEEEGKEGRRGGEREERKNKKGERIWKMASGTAQAISHSALYASVSYKKTNLSRQINFPNSYDVS
jgi:hypothetical protein